MRTSTRLGAIALAGVACGGGRGDEPPHERPVPAGSAPARAPRPAIVAAESVEPVYTSPWSDYGAVRTYAFMGWRARVEGGDADCVARKDGHPVSSSAFVPAHASVELFDVFKVHPEDVARVKMGRVAGHGGSNAAPPRPTRRWSRSR